MISSQATRTTQHRPSPAVYVRRRRALIGATLLLLLAIAASTVGGPASQSATDLQRQIAGPGGGRGDGAIRMSSIQWPEQGQAALLVGGRLAASPHQRPAPIASVAKVMTAYLTLERFPLGVAQDGFTTTVSEDEAQLDGRGQSLVAVRPGEQLTERQLLEALLVPSGNNIARILAAKVAGSEARFVDEMNAQARALGMAGTTYTDPSGFDTGTVSTAADQLRVFERAMRFPVFRQIVSMPSVTLPVAGTLRNYNPLIAEGYGGKTGSDAAAGGCLAFFVNVAVGGRLRTVMGVVLGQGEGNDTSAILAAAGDAATQLVESVTSQAGALTNPTRHLRFLPAGPAPPPS